MNLKHKTITQRIQELSAKPKFSENPKIPEILKDGLIESSP